MGNNVGVRDEGYSPQPKLPVGRSPNSLLISKVNRSGGSLTIEPQPKKLVASPLSSNNKGRANKSSESENEEDNLGGRRIYEDPQVMPF